MGLSLKKGERFQKAKFCPKGIMDIGDRHGGNSKVYKRILS